VLEVYGRHQANERSSKFQCIKCERSKVRIRMFTAHGTEYEVRKSYVQDVNEQSASQ
jgi:hypothetical protein